MTVEIQQARETAVRRTPKKRKNQLPIAIIVLILVIVLAVVFGQISSGLAVAWIFGVAFGVVLQKSRFCFTAAFRDPILTGGTSLSKAVLTAISIALAGFAVIQLFALQSGKGVPGAVNPVGIHVAIGATMFGIGAVISGGCASGTLMRFGEGFMMQWLSLAFFVVGSLWGAHDFGWWQQAVISASPKIHLPSLLGWPAALILQFAVLGGLFFLADWWGKKRNQA
ncbi:hypothetical protein EDC14_1012103 [Hydrogenispora ethanolica]|uniref:Uncharacterized protein n=1 Tax=Hydrogenispora ethanolica TaxID=1082276 RepID=A0A4R1RSP6_HYDET|nr:hypothetical protein EDC14_1012103 [Hydrogenispora ethanolica]